MKKMYLKEKPYIVEAGKGVVLDSEKGKMSDLEYYSLYKKDCVSENIYELCEVFIAFESGADFPTIFIRNKGKRSFSLFKRLVNKLREKDKYVSAYGANWYYWGLRFVATLNKKGELELI